MGRRRKHDGDSGLASDQIPGQNQNNISTGLVTLRCITTRPLAAIHNGDFTPQPGQKQVPDRIRHPALRFSIGRRSRKWPLGKQGDRVQAVEMQG